MKEEFTKRNGSILLPFLVGTALGAGLALLLAPKSGRETREDLKRFASSTRERVASTIDEGKNFYEAGKGAITEAVEAGRKAYVEAKKEAERAA
ncbi:MAG TPA: YtxH domain-containing protein [Nitrospirota bacterium]|nr:YtxH domain-containing protein [Nitrospirota bacterium]